MRRYAAQCVIVVDAEDEADAWNRINHRMAELLATPSVFAAFMLDDAEIYVDEEALKQMVRDFGLGFHPDTRGCDYESLPDGYTPDLVDAMMVSAFENVENVYEVVLDVFKEMQS